MGWTSSFLEITAAWQADVFEMTFSQILSFSSLLDEAVNSSHLHDLAVGAMFKWVWKGDPNF